MRFILCNIISLCEREGAVVDFHAVGEIMSALGRHNLLASWPYQTLPRFIKTHQPYHPHLFTKPAQTVYMIRDPRDMMVSYFHFQRAHKQRPFHGNFSSFLRDKQYGLACFMQHYQSWQRRTTYLLRYEALRTATADELTIMFQALGLTVPLSIIAEAVKRSSVENMRQAQEQSSLPEGERFQPDFRFVRKGKSGEWQELFSTADHDYYHVLCQQFGFTLYP
jgi:hypothetical protein